MVLGRYLLVEYLDPKDNLTFSQKDSWSIPGLTSVHREPKRRVLLTLLGSWYTHWNCNMTWYVAANFRAHLVLKEVRCGVPGCAVDFVYSL